MQSTGRGIQFSGSATDPDGSPPPPAAFSWRVLLVHAEHVHPFLGPIAGVTQGQFTIPSTGHPPASTFFEIDLEVEDGDGLTGTAARAILPVVSPLTFATSPSRIPVPLDGAPLSTPASYPSLACYLHSVEAPASYMLGNTPYAFQW